MKKDIIKFLEESNAIENEFSDQALVDAKKAWLFLEKQKRMTPKVILQTHGILTKNLLHEDASGKFRDQGVFIAGREGLYWKAVPHAIDEWCKNVAVSLKVPGQDGSNIKADHIEYERIHPFIDGNGRTGRMFMNWERLKVGLPLLIIHTGKEQEEYYTWFYGLPV